MMPSSEALWASAGPGTMSPIAQTPSREVRSRPSTLISPRSSRSMPASSRPRPSTSGAAAGGDHQVVELLGLAVAGHRHRRVRALHLLHLRAGLDAHVLLLDLAGAGLGDLGVLERQDLVSASSSSTSVPSRPSAEAISVPEAPAPITHSRLGCSFRSHMPAVSRMRLPNRRSRIGFGTDPVARTTRSALISVPSNWPPIFTLRVVGHRAEARRSGRSCSS